MVYPVRGGRRHLVEIEVQTPVSGLGVAGEHEAAAVYYVESDLAIGADLKYKVVAVTETIIVVHDARLAVAGIAPDLVVMLVGGDLVVVRYAPLPFQVEYAIFHFGGETAAVPDGVIGYRLADGKWEWVEVGVGRNGAVEGDLTAASVFPYREVFAARAAPTPEVLVV
jgi:hypothetical protein